MNKLNDNQEIEERTAFFYQYYGQNVMYVGGKGFVKVGFGGWNVRHPDFFIELTPLDQITDEHAIEVAKILFGGHDYQAIDIRRETRTIQILFNSKSRMVQ